MGRAGASVLWLGPGDTETFLCHALLHSTRDQHICMANNKISSTGSLLPSCWPNAGRKDLGIRMIFHEISTLYFVA